MESQINRVENSDPDAWKKSPSVQIAEDKEKQQAKLENELQSSQRSREKSAAVQGHKEAGRMYVSMKQVDANNHGKMNQVDANNHGKNIGPRRASPSPAKANERSERNVLPPSPRMQKNAEVRMAAQAAPTPSAPAPAPAPARTHGPSR